jgi:hypothetical protein
MQTEITMLGIWRARVTWHLACAHEVDARVAQAIAALEALHPLMSSQTSLGQPRQGRC